RCLIDVNALLPEPVIVLVERVASLLSCLQERLENRHVAFEGSHPDRTLAAPIDTRLPIEAFEFLEIGEAMGKRPFCQPGARPAIVVARIAANVNHAVERAGTSEHPASKLFQHTPAKRRLGAGVIVPDAARNGPEVGER